MAAQLVVGIAVTGLGKRDVKDFWSDLINQATSTLTPFFDSAVQRNEFIKINLCI